MSAVTSDLNPAAQDTVSRIWEHLRAAQALLEELTGEADPMGLRYDRGDDEEPAAPSTRPHDGWAPTGREQRPTNTPAGYASTERRARQVNGRPGSKLPEAVQGVLASGMGTVARGAALTVPTLLGGAR